MLFFGVSVHEISIEILGALFVIIGIWVWDHWRAGISWHRREFKNRILLSLNTLTSKQSTNEKGESTTTSHLKLRTIFEKDLLNIFQNHLMVFVVNKAIVRVKKDEPLLDFPEEDSWYILNAILNRVSEQFATGLIKKDMGYDTTTKRYIFCITYELEGEIRTRKPRIMMMEKEAFLNFPESGEIKVESPLHNIRIKTLRYLRKQYETRKHLFMEVEVCL